MFGGYGRGEGTQLTAQDGTELPFSDYDLIVVTNRITPLINGALKHLEKRLTAELGLPVGLYPYLKKNLPQYEFSLLNYKLRHGHMVIRGDEKILDRMPNYPHKQIPLSEGTRLLLNRGKLLLDIKRRLISKEPLTPAERRRFIKFIFKTNLAFGDCALLMRDAYDISYAAKKERIQNLDLRDLNDAKGIIQSYLQAIEFKERGDFQPLETINVHLWLDEAVQHFQDFFLGYEQRVINRKFRDIKKYAHAFPRLGNEGTPLKNIALNVRTFGFKAFPHLFIHPRIRLYASIALLLNDNADPNDIRWLLRSKQSTFDDLCDNFGKLQQRFS